MQKSFTMDRRTIIAGNWKMMLGANEARELASSLAKAVGEVEHTEVIIAPSPPVLTQVIDAVSGTNIKVSAQNCHTEQKGAFTGEWSAELLAEIGCTHVIVGHSERRKYFHESNEFVAQKALAAFRAGIIPIACIGETLEEREAGETFEIISAQTEAILSALSKEQLPKLVLAYEPVWAIGTGKTATPKQAQEVHEFLRGIIAKYDEDAAKEIRILYGGSVKPENVDSLMAMPDIDGALVGGASLKTESFARIVNYEA